MSVAPAGDGGLREALAELSEWLRDELKTGVPLTVVDAPEAFELAADRIDAILRSHPAAPAEVGKTYDWGPDWPAAPSDYLRVIWNRILLDDKMKLPDEVRHRINELFAEAIG